MNKLLLIISFFGILGISNAQETRSIAFYNVENLFDTLDTPSKNDTEYLPSAKNHWNSFRYNEKLKHINKVVEKLNSPIILGLCEVENRAVVQDIINTGKMKGQYTIIS